MDCSEEFVLSAYMRSEVLPSFMWRTKPNVHPQAHSHMGALPCGWFLISNCCGKNERDIIQPFQAVHQVQRPIMTIDDWPIDVHTSGLLSFSIDQSQCSMSNQLANHSLILEHWWKVHYSFHWLREFGWALSEVKSIPRMRFRLYPLFPKVHYSLELKEWSSCSGRNFWTVSRTD